MNYQEENLQKYQLIQDNIIYILSTSLIGINLKISCFRYEGNNNPNNIYTSIFTIEQLKKSDPILKLQMIVKMFNGFLKKLFQPKVLEYQKVMAFYMFIFI